MFGEALVERDHRIGPHPDSVYLIAMTLTWYAGQLKTEILTLLQDEKNIRNGSYSVQVRVWVRADGTIERAGLGQSTGDRERDRSIEKALGRLVGRMWQAPPPDMPQPINLRVVSRA